MRDILRELLLLVLTRAGRLTIILAPFAIWLGLYIAAGKLASSYWKPLDDPDHLFVWVALFALVFGPALKLPFRAYGFLRHRWLYFDGMKAVTGEGMSRKQAEATYGRSVSDLVEGAVRVVRKEHPNAKALLDKIK